LEFSPDSFEKQETNFQKNISNTEYSLDKFENKKSNNVIQSPKKENLNLIDLKFGY
jgi:hypothetical protein